MKKTKLSINSSPKQVRRVWIERLLSGKLKQGKGQLCIVNPNDEEDTRFCCLGVLMELAAEAKVIRLRARKSELFLDDFGVTCKLVLSDKVIKWAGLNEENGTFLNTEGFSTSLTCLNDRGSTFAEIAEVIKAEPPLLIAAEE